MKKIIAIVLTLVLCLSVMSMAAFAAGNKMTVKVVVPAEWTDCSVYSWGEELFGGWPGTALTAGADGSYSFDLTAAVTGMVLSSPTAGKQTVNIEDLAYDTATNPTITIGEAGGDGKHTYTVSGGTTQTPPPAAPLAIDAIYVAGEAKEGWLNGESWNTSAEANKTTANGSVYTITYPNLAPETYKFKFAANGTWDHSWGGSETPLNTETDAVYNGQDITFTLAETASVTLKLDLTAFNSADKTGAKFTISTGASSAAPQPTTPQATQPQATQPQATTPQATTPQATTPQASNATGNRTLTINAPATWTEVYIYTWSPDDFGTYPGAKVQKSGNAYKATIKNSMVNLVVTGKLASGQNQKTGDIVLEPNKDVTVTVKDDATHTVTYGAAATGGSTPATGNNGAGSAADPTPQGTLSNYRVVGNAEWMGNWQEANDAGRMVEVSPGVYKKNFENVAPGNYELKITKDGKWDGAYGDSNGGNYKFTVTEKCTITVTFTIKDNVGVIAVKGTGVPATADISLVSVIVLMSLASAAVVVLFLNKKKFA